MKSININQQQGSAHLGIIAVVALVILGAVGYLFWTNILQPKYLQPKLSYTNVSGWTTYTDRYVPIAFEHPQDWQVTSDSSEYDSASFDAYTNKDKPNEKLVLAISYFKSYPNTNPNPSRWESGAGVSIKPKCPFDASEPASSDCKLVTSGIAKGYVYNDRGLNGKSVVRWHGQVGTESLDIESYELDEATFSKIIQSISSSSSRTGRDVLISKASLSTTDRTDNARNAQIISLAVGDLSLQKCDEIKGISYQTDTYQTDKVRVYEEWQTLVTCRVEVQSAIKKHKAATLQGDDCSLSQRFHGIFRGLRRILENVTVLSAGDGRVALVQTSAGNKSVSYVKNYYESSVPWLVDTTCSSFGLPLKPGDVISVYVPADDHSSTAYEHDTRVVQRVNIPKT